MKQFYIPIAIIIASIIISVTVYLGLTHDSRTKFNACMKSNLEYYGKEKKKDVKKLCETLLRGY